MIEEGVGSRRARAGVARGVLALFVVCLAGVPVAAQRPHGVPPGLLKKGGTPTSGGSGAAVVEPTTGPAATTAAATPAVRSFGVWLDDATVLEPRDAWLTVSAQRWASPALHGFDVPMLDVAVGLAPRLQVGASVPFTQHGYPGAPLTGQFGDLYVGAKFVVRAPDARRAGLSVTPSVEVLSRAATVDTGLSRVNAVLPVNAEWRFEASRVYASTGYYTRGALFAAGAYERAVWTRCRATGVLTYSRSTAAHDASATWGLAHQRLDAAGSLSWIAAERVVLFGGVARTFSRLDPDSTRYAVSFGVSLDLTRNGATQPRGSAP